MILPIKKKWFDMILSGEKKEEYREIKPYYTARLKTEGFLDKEGNPTKRINKVLFRNGYRKSSPSFEAYCSLAVRTGNPNWGAEAEKEYYVLKVLELKGAG